MARAMGTGGRAAWTAAELRADTDWVTVLDERAARGLIEAVRRARDPAKSLLDYRRSDFDLGAAGAVFFGAAEPAEEGFAGDCAAVHPGVADRFAGDECLYASRDFWAAVLAVAGDYAAGGAAWNVCGRDAVQTDFGCELQEDIVYFAGAVGCGAAG